MTAKKKNNNISMTVGKLITLLSQYKDYEVDDMQIAFSKAGVRLELEFFGDGQPGLQIIKESAEDFSSGQHQY